jgi:hypothetical protein
MFHVVTLTDKKYAQQMAEELTVASLLCEFLEVAFHNILYQRQVYPPGIPYHMHSQHTQLSQSVPYI